MVCVDHLVCDRAGAWMDVSSPVLVTPSRGAWQVQPFDALSHVHVLCTATCPVLCGCADEFCDSVRDAGALSAVCSCVINAILPFCTPRRRRHSAARAHTVRFSRYVTYMRVLVKLQPFTVLQPIQSEAR